MCTYDFQDLFRSTQRTPCPGQPDAERAPTIAGGALGAAIAGCGLLQAQRLVLGNDLELVVNREILVDMTRWKLLPIERRRSDTCLSGHVRWQLTRIGRSADEVTSPICSPRPGGDWETAGSRSNRTATHCASKPCAPVVHGGRRPEHVGRNPRAARDVTARRVGSNKPNTRF